MTEQEWFTTTTPWPMLEFIHDKGSERKWRLFAVACCRLVWHLLTDHGHRLVEAVEQYADQRARPRDLVALFKDYSPHQVATPTMPGGSQAAEAVGLLGGQWRWRTYFTKDHDQPPARFTGQQGTPVSAVVDGVARSAAEALAKAVPWQQARQREGELLHDLFGPLLFRPVTLDPAWLTWHGGLVVSMARQMYESRDFSDMPILADALEEAGCDNADILAHCREPGEHVRGCWVVDLLLGKE
jgi:hypothetical protein